MVRYEKPSRLCCLPLFRGFHRPFKPKIIRLLLTAAFWVITFVWMILCANFATFRYPKDMGTLPDIMFDVLPNPDINPLPEIMFYVLLTSTVVRMNVNIFHSEGLVIARRFSVIAGCIYVFRSITLVVTSLPDPRLSCNNYTASWNFSALLNDKCGDMMGHTVNLALAALVWGQYTKIRFVSFIAWIVSLSDMTLFIMNRSHYTVDVLISLALSIFCWKYYHMVLKLPKHTQNQAIVWLEKLDFGGTGNAAEIEMRSEGLTMLNEPPSSPVPGRYQELVAEAIAIGSPVSSNYKQLVEEHV